MQNISESLRKQREQILRDNSEEALGRHTSLLEIAVISLYNRMVNQIGVNTEGFRSGGAVIALGAFGRGLVGPHQPIPILYLRTESTAWKDEWMEGISAPLVDAGWTVSSRQAAVESLVEQARDDFPFFLSLLEARYISGSRPLMDQLGKALDASMEGRQDEFLRRLYDSHRARRKRFDDPDAWLEPDLLENPGGLSDIIDIRIACRIAASICNLEDAIFRGYLLREEVDRLQPAEKTYIRLLNILQNLGNERSNALHFADQELIAGKLGYDAPAGFLPVEPFMQNLQRLFHGVSRTTNEFWERLRENRWDGAEAENEPIREIEGGVLVRAGRIVVQPDRYPADAAGVIHLFVLAARHGLEFSNSTRQWIQHHRNTLEASADDAMARQEFLDLIRADTIEIPIVRQFYDWGFFAALIPELASVHGLVQHDAFHAYPVHEHHLRTLVELKRLEAGEYSDREPELTRLARIGEPREENMEEESDAPQLARKGEPLPISLFLAAILHDIGKSAGRNHALHGGGMIPAISRRMGLGPEDADMLQFLVAQHLLLNDSAAMRDLADEEMLTRCARTIRTLERLEILLLLSFADMRATGPKASQKWREIPVLRLYSRLLDLIEKGEPSPGAISERIEHIRAQVGKKVADLMQNSELGAHLADLEPRYLLSTSPAAIARHLRLGWTLLHTEEPIVWEVSVAKNHAEITLVSRDMPALLSRTAGIMALHDMNIIGAQLFTEKNGVAIIVFQCRTPSAAPDWAALKDDMIRLVQGKLALDYRIAAHAAGQNRPAPAAVVRSVPTRILIDNDSSAIYTILEVYTVDRIGLLYTIARTLVDLHVRIFVAKITTKVDQVADVFYIKTMAGGKVTDREQMEEIKNALEFWLTNHDVSSPGA